MRNLGLRFCWPDAQAGHSQFSDFCNMKSLGVARAGMPNQTSLRKLLLNHFSNPQQAHDLLDEFLGHVAYDRQFCIKLLTIAKQKTVMTWRIRRLATLMLEHQILKLDPGNLAEFDFLFEKLNLKLAPGPAEPIVKSVISEGYSTTEMRGFILEFRRRLIRRSYLHESICGKKTSIETISDFISLSGRECKLTLARYLFSPEEVAVEILRQMRVTEGVKDLDASSHALDHEMKRAINALPDFEGRILERLCQTGNVYWVSDATGSAVNSLVEYPLTTVVLTIKPPGSDIEFEIKRAGRRGSNPLNIVYARNGRAVPPSHRLDGGNMLWLLQYEAIAASRLKGIYRLVHGSEAPMAHYVSRSTISSIPVDGETTQTVLFFTDPHLFGNGFREMRTSMKKSIDAFRNEGNDILPSMPGDLGLTAQFLGHVAPAQAILSGTTSFRLDKLALYLSPKGPETYFKDGLGVAYTKQDEKRFADELLEEVLGVSHRPNVDYQTYDQYVTAAFRVEKNRQQANRIYLSLIAQIAKFWGTVLGIRGYSRGESFVARNVGLKSYWGDGQWRVKIIFMDHDGLSIPGSHDEKFYARGGLPNMTYDELFLWGRLTPKQFARSSVGCLQSIYRIGRKCDAEGRSIARTAVKEAYQKTQHALLTNPKLQSVFHKGFLSRLLDWDKLVAGAFRMNGNSSAKRKWKKEMKEMLAAKGYGSEAFESYLETIAENRGFLERNLDLFDPERTATGDHK